MVKYLPARPTLDRAFAALGDPTRRDIVARLAERDGQRVTDLAGPYADRMSLPAVSKHLRVLEAAGLLAQRKHGRVRRCHLNPEPIRELAGWLDDYRLFWSDRLDALAAYAEATPVADSPAGPPQDAQPADAPAPLRNPPLPDYLL